MGFCRDVPDPDEDGAPQREHDLREVYNALRWMVRAGAPWRMIPHDGPSWHAGYDPAQRWIAAGVFEAMAHDLRTVLRRMQGRKADPSAIVLDPGAPGHAAEHARERPARRLRRGQAQERIEDPHRGGYAGLPARRDWPCT